jgi:hypothetical protein
MLFNKLCAASKASVSRTGSLTRPETIKQKARRFVAWRKRVSDRDS